MAPRSARAVVRYVVAVSLLTLLPAGASGLFAKKRSGAASLGGKDFRPSRLSNEAGTLHGREILLPESAAISTSTSASTSASEVSRDDKKRVALLTATAAVAIPTTLLLYRYRSAIAHYLNMAQFKKRLLSTLHEADKMGNVGVACYIAAFMLWECLGLSSVPVETVAAMAFGLHKGMLANVLGKTFGSMLAYTIGRFFFQDTVSQKLVKKNEILRLLQTNVAQKPLRSALFMRYSVFPQIVKNFGLSIMPPVTPAVFLTAICIHGIPFSILWSFLGHDSALRLQSDDMAPNNLLNACLIFVTAFGFIGAPALMAFWVRDMKRHSLVVNDHGLNARH